MCSGTHASALSSPSGACEWCAASGDQASALSSGDHASALSSGDHASALSSGDHASALSSGDNASAIRSGDHAFALCCGDPTLAPGSGSVTELFDALTRGYAAVRVAHSMPVVAVAGCSPPWGYREGIGHISMRGCGRGGCWRGTSPGGFGPCYRTLVKPQRVPPAPWGGVGAYRGSTERPFAT